MSKPKKVPPSFVRGDLPDDIKKLQDPNYTHDDFLRDLQKIAKAEPKKK
jgi:hypothetical protein